jgi:hypothetical protein
MALSMSRMTVVIGKIGPGRRDDVGVVNHKQAGSMVP